MVAQLPVLLSQIMVLHAVMAAGHSRFDETIPRSSFGVTNNIQKWTVVHVLPPLHWLCIAASKHEEVIIKCNAIRGSNVYGGEAWNAEFVHNLILIWLINNIYMLNHRQRCVQENFANLPGCQYYYYVRILRNFQPLQMFFFSSSSSLVFEQFWW